MHPSWLDWLSSVDKLVAGSIVGSVVLAFLLLVTIFALRLKGCQERIRAQSDALKEAAQSIADHDAQRIEAEENETRHRQRLDLCRIEQEELREQIEALKESAIEMQERLHTVRAELSRREAECDDADRQMRQLQYDLQSAHSDNETLRKRNEFWVQQLSELRTRYEALKRTKTSDKKERS